MKRTTLLILTMRVLLLFPIFTLLGFFSGVNTLLSILSFALVVIMIVKRGIAARNLLLLAAALGTTVLNLYITKERVINYNEVIYLGYMCVFFVLLTDNKQQVRQYFLNDTRYIRAICILWSAFALLSMFFKSSYEEGVFISFSGTTFRVSPGALFVLTLSTMLIVTNGKKNIIYSVVPILAILLGASRTYLLLGILCLAVNFYFVIKDKWQYIVFLVIIGVMCLLVITTSAMGQKILSSFSESAYLTPMAVFTSGRSNFWAIDLAAYWKQPLFNRILGCGYNFIRVTNGAIVGTGQVGIWAHNDFIQVLITNGILGLVIYLYAIRKMFRAYLNKKMPWAMRVALLLIWLFNAMFNMYYVYVCAMLSLPLLLLACEIGYTARNEGEKKV